MGSKIDEVSVDQLISQLKAVAENPDVLKGASDSQLQDLQRYARQAGEEVEKPFETLRRIIYSPLRFVVPHIAQSVGIFETLNNATEPVSIPQLSERTRIRRFTLETIMDYLCSQRMARQVGREQYTSTKLSHRLMEPSFVDGFIHFHADLYAGWGSLIHTIRDPLPDRTAFQIGNNTELDFYAWLARDEVTEVREAFHRFMESNMTVLPLWFDVVDFPSEFGAGLTDTDVAFVDVGGSIGQQCEEFKNLYPNLPGRVILQDREDVICGAPDIEGVEKMVYDYATEQPIKGARVYYFRSVFHNCTDETCVRILQNHIPALGPDSVIVIDDKTLPDDKLVQDAPGMEIVAGLSLSMKMFFNALERRRGHWEELVAGTGLKIKEVRNYTDFSESAIIIGKEAL